MCGILAIIGKSLPVSTELANQALDTLAHRGPDDRGVWCVDGAWLGHRRLSIIDTSHAGHQPMVDQETGVALTFNGEIYNYIELKKELEALGHVFHSHSDTEVLLRAYLAWGKQCVQRFNGDWAFLIWDPRTAITFFSRDRFAVKPLFYTQVRGVLSIASEPKALLQLYPELRKVNERTLFRFLKETALYDGADSFYEGINVLLPAHSAEYKTDGDTLSIERYWDWPTDDQLSEDNDIQEQFNALLDDAVRLRMRSDVQVGVTLSGGLDSTSVITSAEKQLEHDSLRMKAFTSIYEQKSPGAEIDERHWAAIAAERCGQFDLQMVSAPENLWLETLSKITYQMDGPGYSPAVFPLWNIMEKSARQNVIVLLEGQGADELLAGYSDYAITDFIENFSKQIRRLDFKSIKKDLSAYVGTFGLNFFLKRLLRKLSPFLRELNFYYSGVLGVMRKDFIARADIKAASTTQKENCISHLEKELRADFSARELPGLLQYGDAISMANGVESRLPFLDYRLVNFCSRLPGSWKIRNGETKYILRQYLRRNGQSKIADRKDKKGYPTPLASFLKTNNGEMLRDMLLAPEARIRTYCDQQKLRRLIARYLAGNNQSENSLYRVLSTELWLRQCITE